MAKLILQLINIYGFLHKKARHTVTLVETLRIRDVDKKYIQIANRAISIRGLIKIYIKVKRNNETLDDKELFLLISMLINRFAKAFVIPLRIPIVRLIGQKNIKALFADNQSLPDQD